MMSEPSTQQFHLRTAPNRFMTFFAATRPAFLTASVLPVFSALALSWYHTQSFDILLALLTVINIILIHSGANVLNDYHDAINGTDDNNVQRIFPFSGGSRFIQNCVLTIAQTRKLGNTLIISGMLLGLAMTYVAGPYLLLIGFLGGLVAIFYSAPPCLACRGMGDLSIILCFGVLPVIGTVYIQSGQFLPEALWVGLGIGCFVAAILWVNSIPDIDADRQAGKWTIPARLGAAKAVYGLAVLFVLGFICISLAANPPGIYLSLLAIYPAFLASKALINGQMMPAIPLTLATQAAVCILLLAGYLLPL